MARDPQTSRSVGEQHTMYGAEGNVTLGKGPFLAAAESGTAA